MRELVFVWWLNDGEALFLYREGISEEWVLTRLAITVIQESGIDFDASIGDNDNHPGIELERDYNVGWLMEKAAGQTGKFEPDAVYEVVETCQPVYSVSLN